MKTKYIIGAVAAILLIVTALLSLVNKKIEYMNFSTASQAHRTAQIAGTWVKDKGQTYDSKSNEFRFTMRDEKGSEMPVVLDGAKPNNFELAVSMVATGKVEDGVFRASNVLTKCPSKYESTSINTAEK